MEQQGRELNCWDELVEKATDAEAKAALMPSALLQDIDTRCPRGNSPAHTAMAKSPAKASSTRDPREEAFEESKTQDPKRSYSLSHSLLHLSRSKNVGEVGNGR